MTKRDFFRIIIKFFGLYSLILTVFSFIPSNISFIIIDFNLMSILWIFGLTTFVILLYVFLILKTDRLINLLKIDEGFDEEQIVIGNFNNQQYIKFAIIILGGLLIIDFLPTFLQYSFLAFRDKVTTSENTLNLFLEFGTPRDYFNWIQAGINTLLGYLLITNYYKISKWLFRKETKEE